MRALIAVLLFVSGCASSGVNRSHESPIVSILRVNNQRIDQVTIYLMHSGYPTRRLGQVNGLATETFVLTASDAPIAAELQFLARALASGATDISDPVGVERGAVYEWRLTPVRGHQYLSLRGSSQ